MWFLSQRDIIGFLIALRWCWSEYWIGGARKSKYLWSWTLQFLGWKEQSREGSLPSSCCWREAPAAWRCLLMIQGCGTGTLAGVLFLILLQSACFSTSWENADLALRMWVLCFIAINENWLRGIDLCLDNLMREFSRRTPRFQCSLTCQPWTVRKLGYCFSPVSV